MACYDSPVERDGHFYFIHSEIIRSDTAFTEEDFMEHLRGKYHLPVDDAYLEFRNNAEHMRSRRGER